MEPSNENPKATLHEEGGQMFITFNGEDGKLVDLRPIHSFENTIEFRPRDLLWLVPLSVLFAVALWALIVLIPLGLEILSGAI